jgi:hypothetical protein
MSALRMVHLSFLLLGFCLVFFHDRSVAYKVNGHLLKSLPRRKYMWTRRYDKPERPSDDGVLGCHYGPPYNCIPAECSANSVGKCNKSRRWLDYLCPIKLKLDIRVPIKMPNHAALRARIKLHHGFVTLQINPILVVCPPAPCICFSFPPPRNSKSFVVDNEWLGPSSR